MSDLIERQAAIDTDGLDEEIRCEMCKNPTHTDRGCDGNCRYDEKLYKKIIQLLNKRITPLPPAQPDSCEFYDTESHFCALHRPSAQPDVPDTNVGDMINRRALCDYALNQKDKSVTPNDIMRFPSAQPDGWFERNKDKILKAGMEG